MSGGSMGDKWRGAQEERNEGKLQLLCKINGKNVFYKKNLKNLKIMLYHVHGFIIILTKSRYFMFLRAAKFERQN